MSGRCFAQCDLSEQAKGENVCGKDMTYRCLVGLSVPMYGSGLCTYVSYVPLDTDKVRKHLVIYIVAYVQLEFKWPSVLFNIVM